MELRDICVRIMNVNWFFEDEQRKRGNVLLIDNDIFYCYTQTESGSNSNNNKSKKERKVYEDKVDKIKKNEQENEKQVINALTGIKKLKAKKSTESFHRKCHQALHCQKISHLSEWHCLNARKK